jgi:hypothetical protein
MSERLLTLINDALIKGQIDRLLEFSGLAENSIREIANGSRVPRKTNAYNLALACGCSEQEALTLARECLRSRAKKAG